MSFLCLKTPKGFLSKASRDPQGSLSIELLVLSSLCHPLTLAALVIFLIFDRTKFPPTLGSLHMLFLLSGTLFPILTISGNLL